MALNEPYWNPHFENWMRLTSKGVLERLESGIIVPLSRFPKELPFSVKSKELAEELRTKRWLPVLDADHIDNNFDTKKTLIDELARTYTKHHKSSSKSQRDAWEKNEDSFKERLSTLSPLELKDADNKLRSLPFSERAGYRDHISNYLSERENKWFGEGGAYPNEVGGLHISNLRTLLIGTDEDTATKVTPHMVTVKHPKAGRVNLYKDADSGWRVFDGLASYEGEIEPDGLRSKVLEQLELAPYINDIISKLDANDDRIPRSEKPLMVDGIETFNKSFNDITHVPPPDMDSENTNKLLDLANDLIKNDKQYFEVGVKNPRPEAVFILQNPKAALSIFNDLANSTPESITQLMEGMLKHSYLSAGHSYVPNSEGARGLFQVIDSRNDRFDEPSEPHPVTGYERPKNVSGGLVPYKGMIPDEKDEYRRHFADLYDRPKAWIQHTEEGKGTYDRELEDVKADFDWDDFVEGVRGDSFFAPSLADAEGNPWIPLKDMLDSDGIFKETEEELKVPLSELIPMLDDIYDPEKLGSESGTFETVRDMLSADQIAVIDKIMSSDDGQLAFGMVDQDEGLGKKHKNDTMDILLGEPLRPTPDDWKNHDERGSDDGMVHIGGVGTYPMDEVYKHRIDGLLEMTEKDDDGNYQMVYNDDITSESMPVVLSNALSGTKKDSKGNYGHVMNFDDFLDQSILDQFVKDGVLPQKYASSTKVKAREDASEAPEFGNPLCLARVNFISNRLRDFQTQMPRGYDNEEGFYQYRLDPSDPQAELMKRMDRGKPMSIMDAIYNDLNGTKELGIKEGQFVYASDEARAEFESIKEKIANGESPPITPPPPTDDRGVPMDEDPEEPDSSTGRLAKNRRLLEVANLIQAAKNSATDGGEKQGYSDWGDQYRQNGDATGIEFTREDLENSPQFQAYQEEQLNKQASEVLANAPLDIRVTAFRMRIQGLQDRLDESTTMGEAYDVARDWMRIGAVEYPDILSIDRDGTSKFNKLQYSIGDAGVDWLETNQEWVDHGTTVREREDSLNALQEKINYLDETFPNTEDQNPEEKEAVRNLKKGFVISQQNLRKQGIPEFGSQKHTDTLYNDPDRSHVNEDRNSTPIGEPDRLTTSLKGIKNSLTGALAAGLTTWREMRLYGSNPIAAGLHAAVSTIGEGTGIGADTIRGMDLSKPLEQMPVGYEDSGLRSYFSIGIPGTKIGKRDTMYEQNRKQAGRQGQSYRAPQTTTEEQEAALQRAHDTEGNRVIPTPTPAKTTTSTDPDPYSDPPEQQAPADTTPAPTQDTRLAGVDNKYSVSSVMGPQPTQQDARKNPKEGV